MRDEVLEGLVAELGGSGRTVVVASHRLDEFSGLLDEVWVLAGGRIAAVYDAENLRRQARRVSGHPAAGFVPPEGAFSLGQEGPVGSWAVFDEAARGRLLAAGVEGTQDEPLPMPHTLKALLALHGGVL